MKPTIIDGGSYGEALPSGAYAVLRPGRDILTDKGPIALPPEEVSTGGRGPLYLRISDVAGWQMAGQSQSLVGKSWHYVNGQWVTVSNGAHGVSGLIFDNFGALKFSSPQYGSQGFRYVDPQNRLITGDATYHDTARRIWEYTTFGDVTIGQGATGCLLLRGTQRKLLSTGEARFVRFNRTGNRCAVTVVQLALKRTLLFWFDTSEIDVLPDEPSVQPPPPPPPPEPEPVPENHLAEVKKARDEFASMPPGTERAWRVINRAALLIGGDYGLFAKPSGTNYNGYSIDILIRKGTGETFDCLKDAEGAAVPAWGPTQPTGHGDVSKWRPPVADSGGPNPPPPPPPPSTGYDDTELRKRIDALERRCQILTEDLMAETAARVALQSRLQNLRVKGKTTTTWGHQHEIDLGVQG